VRVILSFKTLNRTEMRFKLSNSSRHQTFPCIACVCAASAPVIILPPHARERDDRAWTPCTSSALV